MPVTLLSSSTPTCSCRKQVIFFRTDIYPFITLKINQMSTTTSQATKWLYTAQTHTVGNRENGVSRSSDGNLEVRLAVPGTGRPGTNPEQLFAAGWSACFDGAFGIAAGKSRVALPAERSIDAEVDLALDGAAFFLQARLNIHLPGLDRT